jgi:hypothetical protein
LLQVEAAEAATAAAKANATAAEASAKAARNMAKATWLLAILTTQSVRVPRGAAVNKLDQVAKVAELVARGPAWR